jgi:hypothetical protein
LFAILTLVFGVLAFAGGDVGRVIGGVFGTFFLIVLVLNVIAGPTCVCVVHTAVHTESLPSLRRVRTANKVLGLLCPLIESAQGVLTADIIQTAKPRPLPARPSAATTVTRVLKTDRGNVHLALFATLLVKSVLAEIAFFGQSILLTYLNMLVTGGVGVLAIVAIVRQHGAGFSAHLRWLTVASLIFAALSYAIGYALSLSTAFQSSLGLRNEWNMFRDFTRLSPQSSTFMLTVSIASLVVAFVLGVAGLIATARHRRWTQPT